MPDDLERERDLERALSRGLKRAFTPPTPAPGGLVAAKRRGNRLRRRRRTVGAATVMAATVAGVAVIVPLVISGPRRVSVQVTSTTPSAPTTTTAPATTTFPTTAATSAGPGSAAATAAPTTLQVTAATPPTTAPPTEPSTFVAETADEHVSVVDSRTGQVIRQLTPVAHDIFGTLSSDGKTFYLGDGEAGLEPGCGPGICAYDVATGGLESPPAFSWGTVTPSPDESISPDGTHAASTDPATGRAITIAGRTGNPVTYHLAGYQVYTDPLWSPDGAYLNVANVPGVAGVRTSAPVVMERATGNLTTVQVPGGCSVEPLALSDRELFASETCHGSRYGYLARFNLVTGMPAPRLAGPPGVTSISSLGTDPSGEYLIASALSPGSATAGFLSSVWTEHDGQWSKVPGVSAAAVAW